RTRASPNQALSPLTEMPSPMLTSATAQSAPGREPGRQTGEEDQRDEDEGPGPGLPMPVVVGRDGIGVDLQRQGRDRLVQPLVPEAVAQRGEQERGRLAGDPGRRHHDSGDD